MPFDYRSLSDPAVANQVLQPENWEALDTTQRSMVVETLRGLAINAEPDVMQNGWRNLSPSRQLAIATKVGAQLDSVLGPRLEVVTNEGYINPEWQKKQARIEAGDASARLTNVPQYIGRESRRLMDPQSEANYNEMLRRLEPTADIQGVDKETMHAIRDWESRPFRGFTTEGLWAAYKKYGESDFRIKRAIKEEAAIRYYIPDSEASFATLDDLEHVKAYFGVSARDAIEQGGFEMAGQQAARTVESVLRGIVGGVVSLVEGADSFLNRTYGGVGSMLQGKGFRAGWEARAGTGALQGLSASLDPENKTRLAEMAFDTYEVAASRTARIATQAAAFTGAASNVKTISDFASDIAKATAVMSVIPGKGKEEGEDVLSAIGESATMNTLWGGGLLGIGYGAKALRNTLASKAVSTAEKTARWNWFGLAKTKEAKAAASVGEVNGTAAKVGNTNMVAAASEVADAIAKKRLPDPAIPANEPAISRAAARAGKKKVIPAPVQVFEDLDPNSQGNLLKSFNQKGVELQKLITSHPAYNTQLQEQGVAFEKALNDLKAQAQANPADTALADKVAKAQTELSRFQTEGAQNLTSSLMQDASPLLKKPTMEDFFKQNAGAIEEVRLSPGKVPPSYQATLDAQKVWSDKYSQLTSEINDLFARREAAQNAILQKWQAQDAAQQAREESALAKFGQDQNTRAMQEAAKARNQSTVAANVDEAARQGTLTDKTFASLVDGGMLPSEAVKVIKAQQMAKAQSLLDLKNQTNDKLRQEIGVLGRPASAATAQAVEDTGSVLRTLKSQSQRLEEASAGILDVTKAMRTTDLRTAEGKALKEELTDHLLNLDAARQGRESLTSIAASDIVNGQSSTLREAAILQKALTLPERDQARFLTEASKLSSLSKTSRERLARLGRSLKK